MRHPYWFFALCVATNIVALILRTVMPDPAPFQLVSAIVLALMPLAFSCEPWKVSLAKCITMNSLILLSEILASMLYAAITGKGVFPDVLDATTFFPTMLCTATMDFALIAMGVIFLPLFRKVSFTGEDHLATVAIGAIIVAQLGDSLIGYLFISRMLAESAFSSSFFFFAGMSMLYVVVDVAIIVVLDHDAQTTERLFRQKLLDDQLHSLNSSYRVMQTQSETLHRLRHDLANQIQLVQTLTTQGKHDEALNVIGEMRQTTQSFRQQTPTVTNLSVETLPAADFDRNETNGAFSPRTGYALVALILVVNLSLTAVEAQMAFEVPGSITYLAPIFITFALSSAAQVFLLQWVKRLRKKQSQLFDAATMNQAAQASLEAKNACTMLAEERRLLLPELESALAAAENELSNAQPDAANRTLEDGLQRLSDLLPASSGNATLDGVLLAKSRQANAAGVKLHVNAHMPSGCPLSDLELASLAFNLIDNALRGAVRVEPASDAQPSENASPTVQFHLGSEAGQLTVSVTNPCSTSFKGIVQPAPIRTAQDGTRHGLGMRIVMALAQTHGGMAEFSAKDGRFTANVMIPLA